ncbi:MAG: DUF885 domain-containing protein [bacterium]|nr:DUF885 domain-containing protein [bacterium]
MMHLRRPGILLSAFFLVAGCSTQSPSTESDEAAKLHTLFAEEWDFRTREDPLLATSVGRNELDHLLPQMTLEDLERRVETWGGFLDRLPAIDRDGLDETDRISADIFSGQLRSFIEDFEAGAHQIPLTVDDGFHIGFAHLPASMPLASAADYEAYISRLRAFPEYVAQHVEHMRTGLERGFTMPRIVLEGYEVTIESHIVDEAQRSVFHRPFESFPVGVVEGERDGLRRAGAEAIMESVVPGYQSFLEFMAREYIPGARTTLGASELPNGEAYYAQRIRHFTTLDLSAEEIHELGLQEVARIRAEMLEIIDEVGFEGDFAAFLQFLRSDARFYAETPEELLREASYIAKRMDAALPALFGTLPRVPYGVAPVPDHLAPKYTSGRYVGSPAGSTQPGYYWVNTYALENRPLYVLPALTLHEAVPGHHLQISLSQELADLPDFRRYSYISAFGEGWGLYSEWLGLEAGIYEDPYDNFGRLTYEMWRACRLVVDTGIHAKGWTREQTMDYMASNTALSLHEVRTETDRYISWPGQALAYKLGEIEIKKLRREAEEALGDRFDVRAFHDAVLANGSVPLPVLREVIRGFIRDRQAS